MVAVDRLIACSFRRSSDGSTLTDRVSVLRCCAAVARRRVTPYFGQSGTAARRRGHRYSVTKTVILSRGDCPAHDHHVNGASHSTGLRPAIDPAVTHIVLGGYWNDGKTRRLSELDPRAHRRVLRQDHLLEHQGLLPAPLRDCLGYEKSARLLRPND